MYQQKKDETHWANVSWQSLEKVSGTVWVSFESCDYREDIKRGLNE